MTFLTGELISNGSDAITKLKKLELMGNTRDLRMWSTRSRCPLIQMDKTIKITDNGLGMTEDEIDKYINQIAFSGVQDFMEKYKDKATEDQHRSFRTGLLFRVHGIRQGDPLTPCPTRRMQSQSTGESEGGIDFEMEGRDKAEVGTTITLISERGQHRVLQRIQGQGGY